MSRDAPIQQLMFNPSSYDLGGPNFGVGKLENLLLQGATPDQIRDISKKAQVVGTKVQQYLDGVPAFPTLDSVFADWNRLAFKEYGTYVDMRITSEGEIKAQIERLKPEVERQQREWIAKYGNTPEAQAIRREPVPTWQSVYNKWQPLYQKQYGAQLLNRPWYADQDAINQKAALDREYINALNDYNQRYGTNFQPSSSTLGKTAQPNLFATPDPGKRGIDKAISQVGNVLRDVGDALENTFNAVLENPEIILIAVAAPQILPTLGVPAVAVQPVTAALVTASQGGDLEDIGKSALAAYAAPKVGNVVGEQVAIATEGSQLQEVLTSASVGASSSATQAAVLGGDIGESAILGAAGSAGASLGRDVAQEIGLGETGTNIATDIGAAAGRTAISGDVERELSTAVGQTAQRELGGIFKEDEAKTAAAGQEPVFLAGDATGIGLMLEQKFTPSDREIDSFVRDGDLFRVYEGFDNNGRPYRYSIVVSQTGNVYYGYGDDAGNRQFYIADAETKNDIQSGLLSGEIGKVDPIDGTTVIDITGVGEDREPTPLVAGIDLRQYIGPSNRGSAVIGGGGAGTQPTAVGFNFLGRDADTGLDRYQIGSESFTLIVLPGDKQALVSDVRDVVFFPEPVPETNELQFTEVPLEEIIKEVEEPKPAELERGPAAEEERGLTGLEGAQGGLAAVEEIRQREREALISRIIENELAQLERDMVRSQQARQTAQQNLEASRQQVERISGLPSRSRLTPETQEQIDAEINLLETQARDAEQAERAAQVRREKIEAARSGTGELSDEDILSYLETGRISGGEGRTAGGEGETAGLGAGEGVGTGEEGEGLGALSEGAGYGAGASGTGIGGGGTGGTGDGRPIVDVRTAFVNRTRETPYQSSVSGRSVATGPSAITGMKEPTFGGDPGQQQDVWNVRSLRLRKALGL